KLARNAVSSPKIAANAVTGAKITSNAVTQTKIANNAITSAKVENGSLLAADFAPGQIPAGPTGPQGPPGPAGPAGPGAQWVFVGKDGNKIASSPDLHVSINHPSPGSYYLTLNSGINTRPFLLTAPLPRPRRRAQGSPHRLSCRQPPSGLDRPAQWLRLEQRLRPHVRSDQLLPSGSLLLLRYVLVGRRQAPVGKAAPAPPLPTRQA